MRNLSHVLLHQFAMLIDMCVTISGFILPLNYLCLIAILGAQIRMIIHFAIAQVAWHLLTLAN